MTLKELNQLSALHMAIELDKQRLARVSNDETNTALRAMIAESIQRSVAERDRLEKYILEIDDPLLRQIFTLRFSDGMQWGEVATVLGGNNTPSSAKMQVYRHLNNSKGG